MPYTLLQDWELLSIHSILKFKEFEASKTLSRIRDSGCIHRYIADCSGMSTIRQEHREERAYFWSLNR